MALARIIMMHGKLDLKNEAYQHGQDTLAVIEFATHIFLHGSHGC